MGNPSQFNRDDGAGYRFLAAQVLAIEKFNPQVAARLLNAFRSWWALEPERRRQAKKVLQGIAKTEGLSRDVFEIASKMIE
jgi:aminopeptidase N